MRIMKCNRLLGILRKYVRLEMMNEDRRDKALLLLDMLDNIFLEEDFVKLWWKDIRGEKLEKT